MDIMNAIRSRRSIRAYERRPVERAIVKELIEAAIMAPSGSNAQPWKFYVVTGQVRKELDVLLLSCMDEVLRYEDRQIGGRSGSHRTEFYQELNQFLSKHDTTIEQLFQNLLQYYDAPVVIIITMDDLVRENTLATGAAIENFLLAACESGLGACWITLPFMRTKSGAQKIRKHLNIPAGEKIISSIALGYPDELSTINSFKTSRDDLDSFVEWIGWD